MVHNVRGRKVVMDSYLGRYAWVAGGGLLNGEPHVYVLWVVPAQPPRLDSSGSGVGSVQDKFHGLDVQLRSVRRLLFERILTVEFIICEEYCRV